MKKILIALFVLLPTLSYAQVISNPTAVTWDYADFLTATRYELGYFLMPVKSDNTCDTTATPPASPVMNDNLGKPTTTTGLGMTATLIGKPIGCYVARMRVLDNSGLYTDWSDVSNPFLKRPSTPIHTVVK